MPTTQYTIFATNEGKEIHRIVYSSSLKNYWVKFFEFLGYSNIRVEKIDLTKEF